VWGSFRAGTECRGRWSRRHTSRKQATHVKALKQATHVKALKQATHVTEAGDTRHGSRRHTSRFCSEGSLDQSRDDA
jgi:hypothetical protein